METRRSAQAIGGRARGALVGALIGFGWAFYAATLLPPAMRNGVVVAALVPTLLLAARAMAIIRRARSLPPAEGAERAGVRRAWRWFWLNLVGEIVLLNVAVALLAAPALRIYWIAAISAVVGLHFLPMAVFFRTRSHWFIGAAMMAGAAGAALLIAGRPDWAVGIASGEALANAAILWIGVAMGTVSAWAAVSGRKR